MRRTTQVLAVILAYASSVLGQGARAIPNWDNMRRIRVPPFEGYSPMDEHVEREDLPQHAQLCIARGDLLAKPRQ